MVLGLGMTGLSALRWLHRHGARLSVADTREAPPALEVVHKEMPEVRVYLGPLDTAWLNEQDLIVASPGLPLSHPVIGRAISDGIEVVGDVELFARTEVGGRVIAITGSNGKSTVTSLVGHLCASAGLDVVVAGNIGLPVLDALTERERIGKSPDVWVLELSSFQLEATHSLRADAATVLNVTADHMDRYATLGDYAAAKQRIFNGCRAQVLNRDDRHVMNMRREGVSVQTFGLNPSSEAFEWGLSEEQGQTWLLRGRERLLPVEQLPIHGFHNASNSMAAMALCYSIGIDVTMSIPAIKSFKGLPHRVELIAEIKDRQFYDDSKGTNVGATVAALNGFRSPVILIAGGDGKGQEFSDLAEAVKMHARAVVLIGRDAERIAESLNGTGVTVRFALDMREAVHNAYSLSQAGDVILLSPACASLDMYRNYVHRAEAFCEAVDTLKMKEAEVTR